MKRTLITFLSFILTTPAFAMISGTVFDENNEPMPSTTVTLIDSAKVQIKGASTELDGTFKIDTTPNPDDKIVVSFVGYETQEFNANEVPTQIQMKQSADMLEQADITNKEIKQGEPCSYTRGGEANDTVGKYTKTSDGSFSCKPNCKFATYTPTEKYEYNSDVGKNVYYWNCELDPNKDRKANKDECTSAELKALEIEHVKSAIVEEWNNETGMATKCKIRECENDDYTIKDNQCVSNAGEPCTPSNSANVISATWQDNGGKRLACLVNECSGELVPNTDKTACVRDEAIVQAEENLKVAKENENSFANKALTGATMAATGIGGMMLASGIAEQRADNAAESEMREYLDTFKCEFGSGQVAHGGDVNVDVPSGSNLFDLYQEYATLANDLKMRKESLGIRPGIESEVVIDKANTGLYDDTGDNISGIGYASIARAISDWTSEDAQQLRDQDDKTSTKMGIGGAVAGVGVIGSVALNKKINSDK